MENLKQLKSCVINKTIDLIIIDILKEKKAMDVYIKNYLKYFNQVRWYSDFDYMNIYNELDGSDEFFDIVNLIYEDQKDDYLNDDDFKEFYIVDYFLSKYVEKNIQILKKI